MIPLPPGLTPTDQLVPYTTLFRPAAAQRGIEEQQREVEDDLHRRLRQRFGPDHPVEGDCAVADDSLDRRFRLIGRYKLAETARRSEGGKAEFEIVRRGQRTLLEPIYTADRKRDVDGKRVSGRVGVGGGGCSN